MKRAAYSALVLIATLAAAAGAWYALHPKPQDPKNIGYVLWKHGLNPYENTDDALDAMMHDGFAGRLVVGHSEDEVRAKFGYLLTPAQRGWVFQPCDNVAQSKKALFLRDSLFLVTFSHGKADELILMRPC